MDDESSLEDSLRHFSFHRRLAATAYNYEADTLDREETSC